MKSTFFWRLFLLKVATFAVVLFFAQKVELVKLGLVEPGLLDREEGGGVLVREPDPVALVVDHPRCLFWRSNLCVRSNKTKALKEQLLSTTTTTVYGPQRDVEDAAPA